MSMTRREPFLHWFTGFDAHRIGTRVAYETHATDSIVIV